VYRALDNLNREVALKLFDHAGHRAIRPDRVLHEGRLLARVKHPNVVVVHGAERFNGLVGLWMEFIHGRTLEDELHARGVFSAREAMLIGLDLCRALAAVHGAGLLHRDIKARNVMRETGGRILLMDFGASTDPSQNEAAGRDLAGTPAYLAPEVFCGQPASRSSDIYSLGVLLYHLVTGRYPVEGTNRDEIQRAHQERRHNRLRDLRPDLPEGFVQTIECALSADAAARYQTAAGFENALATSCGLSAGKVDRPEPQHWWKRWFIPLGLVGAATAFLLVFSAAKFFSGANASRIPIPQVEQPSVSPSPPPSVLPKNVAYTVRASFYKLVGGAESALSIGDRVTPGDKLGLTLEASQPVHVYVVNEDERGERYLLFPLPGQEPVNPLAAGVLHRLPGQHVGQNVHWQVTSAGGREHFVLLVNRTRLELLDALIEGLPRPVAGRPVSSPRVPDAVIGTLRGVGGLASDPAPASSSSTRFLFDMARPLGSERETARGLWVRQLSLENPARR
jgi:serine/threonine-protein kinase